MSKILIFGSSGFIGSNTARQLLQDGYEVLGCDIVEPTRCTEFMHETVDVTKYTDVQSVVSKYKPDYIYNFSAIIRTEECRLHSLRANDVNIKGMYNILESCKHIPRLQRIFFPSTVHIYTDTDKICAENSTPHVNDPLHLYPASKLICEQLTRSYSLLYGIPYTIFRYGIAYGVGGHHDAVTNIFINKVLNHEPVEIYGNNRRSFMYVSDHVAANIACITPSAKNKTINLEGPTNVTMKELLEIIMSIIGTKVNIIEKPARVCDYIGCRVSSKAAKDLIDWSPKISLTDGIKNILYG
ncbi:MAG: hypothetical protein CMM25_05285 [Rhodospirillaceae bacterium]|nr:hypothetical protein [Rhodospirillaceae bacterium]|tara:strand:- start:76 stop:969 length:894 start_codon:yes stop_codon:yes gene_type:complete